MISIVKGRLRRLKAWHWTLILMGLLLLTKLLTLSSAFTEHWYGRGLFPVIGRCLRFLFGWLPFSLGDVLYVLSVLFVLYKILRFVVRKTTKKTEETTASRGSAKFAFWRLPFVFCFFRISNCLLLIYFCFLWLWGNNYSREGIGSFYGLKPERYTIEDLRLVNREIALQTNKAVKGIFWLQWIKPYKEEEMFAEARHSWEKLAAKHPGMGFYHVTVKPSLLSPFLNAMGTTGYYNPLTGESQVNVSVPQRMQPFTTLHEIAHSAGFAKEDEANFAAYLASKESDEPRQRYSTYSDLFLHVNRVLYAVDSVAARNISDSLNFFVRLDYKLRRGFFAEKRSRVIESCSRFFYDLFLKANKQPSGILTYDEVTAYLIAYRKKFGNI